MQAAAWVDRDGLLYAITSDGAPRGRLVVTDPRTPGRETTRAVPKECRYGKSRGAPTERGVLANAQALVDTGMAARGRGGAPVP